MKIHFTIEFENDSVTPKKVKVEKVTSDDPRKVKIAETPPPPIPKEPAPATIPDRLAGSGPQFDPGFLALIRDAHEPFTRRAIAVASGLKVEDVTMRLNRMSKHKWIEQPAPGLWRKTKTFGLKTP